MTFFESIKTVFRNYAEFNGRATRPEFWWFVLFSALVSAALNTLSLPLNGSMMEFDATEYSMTTFFSFASLWSIAVLLPSLAVTVRRLRDAGHEWANVLWILVPIAGVIVLIIQLTKPSLPQTVPATNTPVVN